ncbi:MAG: hypothetical protein KF764_08070 [Labilithrix sp.]|nr:hypothetical protein [Labilithrix sp.]MBX3223447.1 hypothetical protein [Labilithrix sp.]
MIARSPFVFALVASIAALAGCDSAERRDAQSVVIAVTRFRTADNASTPAMVEALKATPCSAPDACKARDDCAATGEATAKALRLKAEVEKGLDALEKGTIAKDSPEAAALPKKLDEAEVLLKQGHDGLARCDEQIQALKRKHRI